MEKTDDKTVGRESDKFMLRFPEGMRQQIAALAKHNGRSMNAEIIARLEGSLKIREDGLDALAEMRVAIDRIGKFLIAQDEKRPADERQYTAEQMKALRDAVENPSSKVHTPRKKR